MLLLSYNDILFLRIVDLFQGLKYVRWHHVPNTHVYKK